MAHDIYIGKVLDEVSRLLSWIDREPFSKTYGCGDRTHWCWKFTDFPGSRFQEAAHALAFLYSTPDNPLSGKPQVRDWGVAAMQWWAEIQYADGSFDEAYPFEHSLAATAFTGFYVGEAFRLMQPYLSEAERTRLLPTLSRTADWLCTNDERHGVLSNHLAAAAGALEVIYQITGEPRYRQRSRHFLRRILDHQSKEGWYTEYGGFDAGYQTHGIFYLARVWEDTGDAELFESLARSVAFLKHFFHPDRTLGGEYASRNTEFYYPAGFEILADVLPDAAAIAAFMRPAVAAQNAAGLTTMDAYNFLPLLNNYLFAGRAAKPLAEDAAFRMPCRDLGRFHFPQAGILVDSRPGYVAYVGLSKGGTVKVFARDGSAVAVDCGYWTRIADGSVASSQSFSPDIPCRVEGDEITLDAPFVKVNQQVLTPWLFLGFRGFTLTLGRFRAPALWIKDKLVQVLVRRRKSVPLRLTRRIRLGTDAVSVEDVVTALPGGLADGLHRGTKYATFHMGSSRYFQPQELVATGGGEEAVSARIDPAHPTTLAFELKPAIAVRKGPRP